MSVEFWVTSIVVVVMPGTGVLYMLAVGLGRGFGASLAAAVGCTLGIVPHVLASVAGLAAILHTSAVLFQIVKALGVLYLLYMAWSVLREGGTLSVDARRDAVSPLRLVRDGVLINVLNPKLSLFFLAFLPQFVPVGADRPTLIALMLAGAFMALTFAVFILYGALAAAAREAVITRPAVVRWMRRSFAAAFGLLGLRLALAER